MLTTTECDIDTASWGVFCRLQREAEGRVASNAYSDAPLTSTGNLVPRKVVRVRAVGPKRMYDLEVAHPKHNFLLPNGAVTSNSHSVSYMYTAYACAWLKHHYPLEWWTSVLSNADRKDVDDKFWRYVGPMVLMPDVSKSQSEFVIEGNKIRAPVWLVHGIGPKAYELLSALAPFRDLEDLLSKIENWRTANGTKTTKTDKKTGQLVEVLKKAHNPLNDPILRKMIVCGVLDGLYPATDAGGLPLDTVDKLSLFDQTAARVRGKKKVKPSAVQYNLSSPVARYQYIKSIMPAYSVPLLPLIQDALGDKLFPTKDVVYYRSGKESYAVLSGDQFEWLENLELLPPTAMQIAVPAYVLSQRVFDYQNKTKKACDLTLDIDGHRRSFVKWPSKEAGLPPEFKKDLTESIVIAMFTRRRPTDEFFFQGIDVVVGPPQTDKPEESPISD